MSKELCTPSGLNTDTRILVMGSDGLLGSALLRRLKETGYINVTACSRTRADLRDRDAVDQVLRSDCPHIVLLAAAHVGGVQANKSFAADFIFDNLLIQTNVIDSANQHRVRKLVFFGSNAMYPTGAAEPIGEEALMSGALERNTEPYALAKIAGVKMCQAYRRQYGLDAISIIPTNLYGPNDNFDPETSHVMPALLRKFYEAQQRGSPEIAVWGTGRARREFIYADDLADACLFLMHAYSDEQPINVGCSADISIGELAELISHALGLSVRIVFDPTRPEGASSKLLDSSRVRTLGWAPKTVLSEGIRRTYQWLTENWDSPRIRRQLGEHALYAYKHQPASLRDQRSPHPGP